MEALGELGRKGSRICERDRICPIYYEYLISKQISEGVKLLTLENMFLTCKTDHKSFKAESSLVFKNNNVWTKAEIFQAIAANCESEIKIKQIFILISQVILKRWWNWDLNQNLILEPLSFFFSVKLFYLNRNYKNNIPLLYYPIISQGINSPFHFSKVTSVWTVWWAMLQTFFCS